MLIEIKRDKKMAPESRRDLNGLFFCASALSKDKSDFRPHVTNLFIDDGVVYGTDGSRLHTYRPQMAVKDGWYRVFKAMKTHIIFFKIEDVPGDRKYPNIDAIVNREMADPDGDLNFVGGEFDHAVADIIRALPDDSAVSIEFLKSLNGLFSFKIAEDGMLFFDGIDVENKRAFIMPKMHN